MRGRRRGCCVFLCPHVYIYVCVIFQVEPFFSQAAAGRRLVTVLRPSRKFSESILKRDSPSRSADRGRPMTSFTPSLCSLTPLLCVVCAVIPHRTVGLCVCVCERMFCQLFHTCCGWPPKLCNLESPPLQQVTTNTNTTTHTSPPPKLPLF